jgi:hypothetical protein
MGERIKVTAKKPLSTKENSASHKRRTSFRSQSSHVDRILFLQRTVGNQAVQRLIKSGALQTKLRIGQPGDIYEQEADRVAEQVMRMPEPQIVSSGTPYLHSIQRTCIGCEDEVLSRQPIEEEKEDELRRQPIEEEEEEIQAKATSGGISEVSPDIESHIQNMRGGGQPLPKSERTFFEQRFGRDFGQVRVHTDAKAARAVNARAFTVGRDVVFGAGHYASGTSEGQKLMAHELTHVVQQTGDYVTDFRISRIPRTLIQRIGTCGTQCRPGTRHTDDPDNCGNGRECLGCLTTTIAEDSRQPSRYHYKVYYCPDSRNLNTERSIEQYGGRTSHRNVSWDVFCSHVRSWIDHGGEVRVFGFASPESTAITYNNRFTAMHRATNMWRRLQQCVGSYRRGRFWKGIEGNGETNEGSNPDENRFVWIEHVPPLRQPERPPEYFGCLGPNPVPADTWNAECQARQFGRFTGHCTGCELPSNYYCETDVCVGTETRQEPNPGNFCYNFYDAGRRDEAAEAAGRRGRRNERFYEQGARTDLMANCCRCYRMGVDDQRRGIYRR